MDPPRPPPKEGEHVYETSNHHGAARGCGCARCRHLGRRCPFELAPFDRASESAGARVARLRGRLPVCESRGAAGLPPPAWCDVQPGHHPAARAGRAARRLVRQLRRTGRRRGRHDPCDWGRPVRRGQRPLRHRRGRPARRHRDTAVRRLPCEPGDAGHLLEALCHPVQPGQGRADREGPAVHPAVHPAERRRAALHLDEEHGP